MPKLQNKPLVPIHTIDFKRCRATSKRHGGPCNQPAMRNDRCRFHGGKSTGPRTENGKKRATQNALKHGLYSQGSLLELQIIRQLIAEWKDLNELLQD